MKARCGSSTLCGGSARGAAGLSTRVTKRTYWEGTNARIKTESQTTSILKAVTLVSQFRNSASAKPGKWHPVDAEMSEDGELACHHECASEAREAA
jgi:hypothetical protein